VNCGEKGWGVVSLQDVPKGYYCFTYTGEIMSTDEFEDREKVLSKMCGIFLCVHYVFSF